MLSIQCLKRKYKSPSAFIHRKKWRKRYLESQEGICQPILIDRSFYLYVSKAEKHTVASRRGSPEGLHIKSERKADKSKGWFSETTVPASSSGMLGKTVIAYIKSIHPIFSSIKASISCLFSRTRVVGGYFCSVESRGYSSCILGEIKTMLSFQLVI